MQGTVVSVIQNLGQFRDVSPSEGLFAVHAAGGVPELTLGTFSVAAMLSDRTIESAKVSFAQKWF